MKFKEEKNFHSTQKTARTKAEEFAAEEYRRRFEAPDSTNVLLKEYAREFYVPGKCPHMLRLAEESKSVSDESAEIQRGNLKNTSSPTPLPNENSERFAEATSSISETE